MRGRRVLMFNSDIEIAVCRPTEEQAYFFRNGEGDEVIFVHEGSGEVETNFGTLPYRARRLHRAARAAPPTASPPPTSSCG